MSGRAGWCRVLIGASSVRRARPGHQRERGGTVLMRARLAFGLVVILAVGAIAGWRRATPAATQAVVKKPHATVTHSAPPTRIAAVNPLPVGGEGLASI